MIREIITGTFVVVGLFLVVTNANKFSEIVKAVGEFYAGSVKALQGR